MKRTVSIDYEPRMRFCDVCGVTFDRDEQRLHVTAEDDDMGLWQTEICMDCMSLIATACAEVQTGGKDDSP